MIKNYFKIAWRHVVRHKSHTVINVTGLALGITCCMFIFLWVQDEKGIDNFHANGKNLYTVYRTVSSNGNVSGAYNSGLAITGKENKMNFVVEHIAESIPEIKGVSFYATGYELPWGHPETFQVGEKKLKLEGSRASKDFFKMFSYPIIAGSANTALQNVNTIAISRKMAVSFFGAPQNAIGKSMRYENKLNFIVGAVFEDVPHQSSLKFDFLFNWDVQKGMLDWSSNNFQTYLQLADNADINSVTAKINAYIKPRLPLDKGVTATYGLQRFGDQYLHDNFANGVPSGGRIEYVQLFSEVAIFILIIACINFMNLATARSVKRAKEVGVRKVAGSTRTYLILQFYGESLVYAFLAMLLSVVLLQAFLPAFDSFTGKQFGTPIADPSFWISLFTVTLVTGLIAGSYPALYLSSLKPVSVLKGVVRFSVSAIWFRKGLTIFQFVLSIILLIATIVITRQTNYIENKHLGYDRENLVYIRIEGELMNKNNYLLFKQEASGMPGIAMIDRSTEAPHSMDFVVADNEITWQGRPQNSTVGVKPASVGFDFVKIMKLKIAEGRDFSPAIATDSTQAYLINQEAAKEMNMQHPIGQWINAWGKKGYIVGVLQDYHTQSLREPIKPVVLDVKEGENFGVILIRTQMGQTNQALASLAKIYRDINPNYPFDYQFVDAEYKKLYSSEQVMSSLSVIFAIVAIMISSLGLLGLVMFSAEQRVKEFGVRKVLGASMGSLVALFAQDFMKLVMIAFLIAMPLGWYAMHSCLQDFAYRVDLSWWIFALAALISALIAFAVLSYEAIKTALANPVKSLRSE
jgi:putative ABC transport system permease protein